MMYFYFILLRDGTRRDVHGKFENYSQKISTFRPYIINPAAQSRQETLAWYNGCWIIIT